MRVSAGSYEADSVSRHSHLHKAKGCSLPVSAPERKISHATGNKPLGTAVTGLEVVTILSGTIAAIKEIRSLTSGFRNSRRDKKAHAATLSAVVTQVEDINSKTEKLAIALEEVARATQALAAWSALPWYKRAFSQPDFHALSHIRKALPMKTNDEPEPNTSLPNV